MCLICLILIMSVSLYKILTLYIYLCYSFVAQTINITVIINTMLFNIIIVGIFFIPFAIKIPVYPMHYWLPEMHCEVNTSLSIILAGIIIKYALQGVIIFLVSINWVFMLQYISVPTIILILGSFNSLLTLIQLWDAKKLLLIFGL